MSVAWVLNLDADLELAGGTRYSPSKAVVAAMAAPIRRLAESLLGPDDVLVEHARRGDIGRAFCPTPRAVATMQKAGATPEPYPDFEILRRVNGRAFCAELGATLPGGAFVRSLDDALRVVAVAPPVGRQWRAKRAFGMSGRGQRPMAPGALAAADIEFVRASVARDGGIQIEPEVDIVREVGIHGTLTANGDARLGVVVEQRCDASGQWQSSAPTTETIPAIHEEAERVAAALHDAGYFGPFGVDAFFYRHDGQIHFQPRSEINARYSMGFAASGLLRFL